MKIEPAFFDLAGASKYTGGALSVRTLRRLIAKPGGLPFYRVGRGKILLKRIDIDIYLERHRQEAIDLNALAEKALTELNSK